MINRNEGDLRIAEDEFTDILAFELNEFQNSFSVIDIELGAMHVCFKRSCNCDWADFLPVISGCIQGDKQSNGT